ncbi:hypothetical protein HF521_001956 [Silurus meridionalis]|uniref:Amine oxidase n=1 Tax=Silurus meridionalis TaxID=175797 RepID=A0A8T0B326_SILME|nr:hypothetical protein HF521_001956 [Silurus meridionalis]
MCEDQQRSGVSGVCEVWDVVVVGGGLSGLCAARRLKERNQKLRVLVLEAKDRVGGRTLTLSLPASNGRDSWDMGGQWVGSTQTHVMDLIQELGLEVYPQFTEGKKIGWGERRGWSRGVEQRCGWSRGVGGAEVWSRGVGGVEVWVEQRCGAEVWSRGVGGVEVGGAEVWGRGVGQRCGWSRGVGGAEVWVEQRCGWSRGVGGAEVWGRGVGQRCGWSRGVGGAEVWGRGGTQQLSERISEQLGKENVRLGSAVKAIWQNEESVEVKTAMSTITCKAVIVSCPPHMAALIEYRPALPLEHQRLAQSMPVGHMTKFIITYPTAFWKQKGYSGEILARPSIQCPFGVTFDASSPSGSPALVGFIAGVQSCYWNSRETEERRDAVVSSLVKYLGPEAASYIHYQEKDWAEEEYNGGCPVNVMGPGMLTFYHPGLRKPCGRIFWAGTETAMQWCGYLSGAVQSGNRAALEVLADVSPDVLSQSELQEVKADLIRAPLDLSRVWDCTHGSVTSSRLLAGLTVMVVAVGGAVLLLKPGLAKNCLSHVLAVV